MKKQSMSINKTSRNIFAALLMGSVALVSCEKNDDDEMEDEGEELITTVEMTFVENGTSNAQTFNWRDIDGPGGEDPVIDNISLSANTEYSLSVRFLNESESPAENITEEIMEEDDEHLVCYSNTANITLNRTDKDDNDLEVGLTATVSTGDAANGNFGVILRHQPGVKNGSCDLGDTDIDVTLPISIN